MQNNKRRDEGEHVDKVLVRVTVVEPLCEVLVGLLMDEVTTLLLILDEHILYVALWSMLAPKWYRR